MDDEKENFFNPERQEERKESRVSQHSINSVEIELKDNNSINKTKTIEIKPIPEAKSVSEKSKDRDSGFLSHSQIKINNFFS